MSKKSNIAPTTGAGATSSSTVPGKLGTSATSTSSSSATVGTSPVNLLSTLRFYWFTGHVFFLIGAFNYLISYIGIFPSFAYAWYRVAFFSAIVSYGISIFETYFDKSNTAASTSQRPSLKDENIQYFGIAMVWLLSSPVLGALVPFAVYALLHSLSYTRLHLLPAFGQPTETSDLSIKINNFTKRQNGALIYVAASAELFLWFRLLLNLFLLRGFIKFILYTLFFKTRYETSRFNRQAVKTWEIKADGIISNAPPVVRNIWLNIKQTLNGLPLITGAGSISDTERSSNPLTAATQSAGSKTGTLPGGSGNALRDEGVSSNLRDKIQTGLDDSSSSTSNGVSSSLDNASATARNTALNAEDSVKTKAANL